MCFVCLHHQWSFGVTCWEIFSLGRQPYPGVQNSEIATLLEHGKRLSKPPLCDEAMCVRSYYLQFCITYVCISVTDPKRRGHVPLPQNKFYTQDRDTDTTVSQILLIPYVTVSAKTRLVHTSICIEKIEI